MYPFKSSKKKSFKVAVLIDENLDEDISLELLKVLYEPSEIDPVCVEEEEEDPEQIGTTLLDQIKQVSVNAKKEIIAPLLPWFESEIFVFNYGKS